ncbi:MAG: aquaporin [Nitrososphaerota archaeon]|nr:aquaporin [Nitrososphaerota archaeon]
MKVLSAAPSLSKKLAAEALGTFVFVLVGAGSAVGTASLHIDPASGILIAAFANGLGLAVAVSATMGVSGGALNPAVAFGLWVGRKLKSKDLLPYIIAELAGAIAAGLALVAAFPSVMGTSVEWGSPTLNGALTYGQGIAIEAMMTFFLVFAVYGTAVDARAPHIGGLGIGLAVVADVLVAGSLTGAAMNPARAFGPMIAGGFYPAYWYIYLIGPVIGGVLAGLVYRYLVESPN